MTRDVAERSAWWRVYEGRLSRRFAAFLAVEARATRVRQYQSTLVPGLLQAPGYARELVPLGTRDAEHARVCLEVRLRRAELVTRHAVPAFFVVDESVLHRRVGGVPVLREQLRRLGELAGLPSVSLRVLPFAAGAHLGQDRSFQLLDQSGGADDHALLLESVDGDRLVLDPDAETRRFPGLFDDLARLALPASETPRLLAERLAALDDA